MVGFLIRWLVNIVALLAVVHIVPGIGFDSMQTAVIAALVLGLVNAVLKPVVIFITLPITILSLGIFTLFINGFMLFLVSRIVKGFIVTNFWSAFWGAMVFSVISFLLNLFINPQGRVRMDLYRRAGTSPRNTDFIDAEFKVEDKDDKHG